MRRTPADRARVELDQLAARIAAAVDYDVRTVRNVLDLAVETGCDDPEEFLRRCKTANLDPLETIAFMHFEQTGEIPRASYRRVTIRRSRRWAVWACVGALAASFFAATAETTFDAVWALLAVAGCVVVLLVELDRPP